jgi:hypothetical protein
MRLTFGVAFVMALSSAAAMQPTPRPPAGAHVVIPALANSSKPDDLDFQAGECEVRADGAMMDCVFQQVFLTLSFFDAQTCLITTNRYERTFRKEADGTWISREGPEGECGLVDETRLRTQGGDRWTLESRTFATRRDGSAACGAIAEQTETLSWQNQRRPLPCRFVQPGAMSR